MSKLFCAVLFLLAFPLLALSQTEGDPVFDYLVWADEFDQNGALDGSKWFHQTKLPEGGNWYNGEIQHYTNRTDNAYVENGVLYLVAKKETFTDQGQTKQYTSARLNSKFAFTYGRVEVRAKLPSGIGTWPAIWTLGKNISEDGAYWQIQGFGTLPWPACGEMDIMEHWGNNQNFVQSATHTPSSFGATVNHGGQNIPTVSSEFHVYSLDWTPDKLVFAVDGVEHFTYHPPVKNANTWPFDADQYLLLNIAIQPSITPDFVESAMEIDYVRVYQESPTATREVQPETNLEFYPNPVGEQLSIVLQEASDQPVSVQIYAADGQLAKTVACQISNNTLLVEGLGDLAPGVYVASFKLGDVMRSVKFMRR